MDQEIKVLIVDDHPVVREGVAAIINQQPDMTVVAEAGDGVQAIELFDQNLPDVTLVDLRMPAMEGVELIERIRAKHPNARMIVLTTFDSDEDIARGLRAGARAFLLKDVPRAELISCIRDVNDGKTFVAPAVASKLAERISRSQLTTRELEVLRLLATGKSNKKIADALAVTEGTIKVHVNSLFTKLEVGNRTEAIATAVRRGLVRIE